MLYFAYGSNLNQRQMRKRCPLATPMFRIKLKHSKLVFRGVADCIYDPRSSCEGALWEITRYCEDALDKYEGVHSGHYRKVSFRLEGQEVLFYQMNSDRIMPPSDWYFSTIREGYHDFGIPMKRLYRARQASFREFNQKNILTYVA